MDTPLELYGDDHGHAESLVELLAEANSIYAVSPAADALKLRVEAGVKEVVQESVAAATLAGNSAGDYLRGCVASRLRTEF